MPKFYRIATAGETIDGRKILKQDLKQAFETYDPKKYTALINIEHLKSLDPNGIFKTVGEVLELQFKEKDENNNASLYAKIDINEQVKEFNKNKNKIFFSVELVRNFAQTKKTYLVGLALTDSPATLFSDRLEFSKKNQEALKFTHELTAPIISEKDEKSVAVKLSENITEQKAEQPNSDPQALNNLNNEQKEPPHSQGVEDIKVSGSPILLKKDIEEMLKIQKNLAEQLTEFKQEFSELKTKLNLKLESLEQDLKDLDLFTATNETQAPATPPKFYY